MQVLKGTDKWLLLPLEEQNMAYDCAREERKLFSFLFAQYVILEKVGGNYL